MGTQFDHMSRREIAALGLALAGGLASGGSALAQAKAVKWKGVANTRNSRQWTDKWEWLAKELPATTDGRFTLEMSSFPELGLNGAELIRLLNTNTLDIAEVITGYVSGDAPLFEGVQLPGVYKDYEQARQGYEAWLPAVVQQRERVVGGRALNSFAFSNMYMFTKFPMKSLDDLKGKKIRIFAKSQADYLGALGAEPVSIPLAESYTSLERGTVDGLVTGPETAAGMKIYEVTKYVIDLNLGVGAGFNVVSRKSWDALPADLKQKLETFLPEMSRRGWDLGAEETKTGIEIVTKNGVEAIIPGRPEWAPTLAKITREVVLPSWSKRAGPQGAKLFNEVLGPIVGVTIA